MELANVTYLKQWDLDYVYVKDGNNVRKINKYILKSKRYRSSNSCSY